MKKLGIIAFTALFVSVYLFAAIAEGKDLRAMVIDGPWSSLPVGAGSGLAFDSDWDALTLATDVNNLVFMLVPDPNKRPATNNVTSLLAYDGRLYLGYGDWGNNRGPVDFVAYNPLSGTLIREMIDVPEEGIGGWEVGSDGRLYVPGIDAMESSTFGNVYVRDAVGWQKRRTVFDGNHTGNVVFFQGRLYITGLFDVPDYPVATVSDNLGASWKYERLNFEDGWGTSLTSVVHQIPTRFGVRPTEFLYAEIARQLYRFNGTQWSRVEGIYSSTKVSLQGILFVKALDGVYALDGITQYEIPFLREEIAPNLRERFWAVNNEWTYFMKESSQGNQWTLYRTQDMLNWQMVGPVNLPAGVEYDCIAFSHGRLYVGAGVASPAYGEDWENPGEFDVEPIQDGRLYWDAEVPEGAELAFRVCTGGPNRPRGGWPNIEDYVGSDGTSETFFTISGEPLHQKHNGDIWISFVMYRKANTKGEVPFVRRVTFKTDTQTVTMAIDEGQGLYTTANSTDPNGTEYVSQTFELDEPIASGSLFFQTATPGQTSVRFQVRSALTGTQLIEKPFVGPDGSAETFYESEGEAFWTGHDGDLHVQYRAVLASFDPTLAPFLRKVVLLTQADALHHFDIELDESDNWTAGESYSVMVTARSEDGNVVPIEGRIRLDAVLEDSGNSVPIEPEELTLEGGIGTAEVSLQQAKQTWVVVELAGVKNYSSVIDVQPGEPASISMTSNVPKHKQPNFSPSGTVGEHFTLSLTVMDEYHNTVTDYTGTVRCERWSWKAESDLFAPYTFQSSDYGSHEFDRCTIVEHGEWNLVCYDAEAPRIAGTHTVSMYGILRADLNTDGRVDFKDFVKLGSKWHQSNLGNCDIVPDGGDGKIDFLDISVLAEQWLSIAWIQQD